MTADIDLDEGTDQAEPAPRRVWPLLVMIGLWLGVGLVALPLLAFGLERTGAVFGRWSDWPEWWARDMWVLAIGTTVLYLCLGAGLLLGLLSHRWISAALFGFALFCAIIAYTSIHEGYPERFQDVMDVVNSVTGSPAPTGPRPW